MVWSPCRPRVGEGKNRRRAFLSGKSTFKFNNESMDFAGDWNPAGARKLWMYNLHYMAWIFDLEEHERDAWINRWICENPPDKGGNGWEPYPLSLRLFNWCKHYGMARRAPEREVLDSMALQAGWLAANLEFHLDGNHLLENLLSMAFAGFHFDPHHAGAAASRGRIQMLLEIALSEQFLPDGGHYELSPMYHAILLEKILDLLDFWPIENDPFPGLREKLRVISLSGLKWLEAMTVGGRFALFNDSAYDTAPDADMLLEYGNKLLGFRLNPGVPLKALGHSGYFRAEAGPMTLIFDGGPLGPDHQMGHAQGDMLSFCLWIRDIPLIVHPGCYEYVPGPMRDYCRSTASHNTLVVDGHEQAEWWASHRVGWRGRSRNVSASAQENPGMIAMEGAHDGYSRLPGRPMHRRKIEMTENSLVIRDALTADPGNRHRLRFHFHPDVHLEQEPSGVRIRSKSVGLLLKSELPVRLEDAWHCPEFGLRMGNKVAVIEGDGLEYRTCFTLEL